MFSQSPITSIAHYNRIIVFCDYGLDDAIATLHILHSSEKFGHIDIVPVGGNVDVTIAYRNAHTLLAAASADKAKVRIIDTRDIKQPSASIPDVHGGDGMGDVIAPRPSDISVINFAEFAAALEREKQPEKDCVLSLGPCTLPNMLDYVPFCTVLMGGATHEPPNYGDYEFNEALDPSAFKSFALRAAAVATLDTCHNPRFDFEHFDMQGALGSSLVRSYKRLCAARKATFAVYDYVAALAVTNPEKFDVVRVRRPDGVEYNESVLK